METKRTSVYENGLIWFGAGVSIAEILTGTYLAPLGFQRGLTAVIIGHIIGCCMMFFAGLIGARMRKSAMETVKMSFGRKGGLLFAVLNVLQLVGWTAIMIYDGALAADGIFHTGAMAALFILTILLCRVIFFGGSDAGADLSSDAMSFGAAVELSVAMPLSWLPVISDYTREAEKPVKATAASVIVYGLVSCWMYVIGMGAAIYTGETDIAIIMAKAGLGIAALLIVIFSTVTTTFLDAYSAGVSSESIFAKLKGNHVGIVVTVIGTIAAIIFPMDDITDFLYLIGSVFAPMIAVQIADVFILRKEKKLTDFDWKNLVIWLIGFIVYRWFMTIDIPVGNTLPDMAVVIVICLIVEGVSTKVSGRNDKKNQGSIKR